MLIPISNLLYFHSTLAQTSAGILAFTGVFIVFRLERINSTISNYHEEIFGKMGFFGAGDYEKVIERARGESKRLSDLRKSGGSIPSQTDGNIREIEGLLAAHDRHFQVRKGITRRFLRPLFEIAFVIVFSILNLCCLPSESPDILTFYSLMAFIACLIFIWALIDSIIFVKDSL